MQGNQLDTVTRSPGHQGHRVMLGINQACVLSDDKITVLETVVADTAENACESGSSLLCVIARSGLKESFVGADEDAAQFLKSQMSSNTPL